MKITVLVENNSRIDRYLLAEPAFSLFIEIGDKNILFDTGYSNVFLKNANALNIDLGKLTDIVLSHGHDDHSGGLRFFNPNNRNIKLTAHPRIFDKKVDNQGISYGCPISQNILEKNFVLNLTTCVYKISENLYFLGEIENNSSQDIDDSALVYVCKNELLIITGCSHSGIINIINYAKKVTGIDKIYGVFGGMHLLNSSEKVVENLSKFFQDEQVKFIAPCHCCDLKSKIELSRHNLIQEVCVGDVFVFD